MPIHVNIRNNIHIAYNFYGPAMRLFRKRTIRAVIGLMRLTLTEIGRISGL